MNIENIKEKYTEGTRIELNLMKGESQMPSGLKGTVTHVDDAGQVHIDWDNGSSLALNVIEDSFKIIDEDTKIKVLFIEPHKYPRVIDLNDTLEDMQKQQSKCLAAMLNHQITGNGIDEMKKIRDELLENIIEK